MYVKKRSTAELVGEVVMVNHGDGAVVYDIMSLYSRSNAFLLFSYKISFFFFSLFVLM